MADARFQHPPDLHETYSFLFLRNGILPMPRIQTGIPVLQLLGGQEGDFIRQKTVQLRISAADKLLRILENPENAVYRIPQGFLRSFLLSDDLLPIPLIHIKGMQIVRVFVPPDGIHIRIQAFTMIKSISFEGHSLPLRQGMNDLHLFPAQSPDVKDNRPFHPIQVVVQAGFRCYKKRRGNPH